MYMDTSRGRIISPLFSVTLTSLYTCYIQQALLLWKKSETIKILPATSISPLAVSWMLGGDNVIPQIVFLSLGKFVTATLASHH